MAPEDQGELRKLFREIRGRYACNALIPKTSRDGIMLSTVIRRHPQWPAGFIAGIQAFRTGQLRDRNQRGFRKVDDYGVVKDIDLRACINGEAPSSEDLALEAAIRHVRPLLEGAFGGPSEHCGRCGKSLAAGFTGMINHEPECPVSALWADYRRSNPEEILLKKGDFVETEIAKTWVDYWKANVKLSRVCSRCFYTYSYNV